MQTIGKTSEVVLDFLDLLLKYAELLFGTAVFRVFPHLICLTKSNQFMTQRDRSLVLKNGLTIDVIDDSRTRLVYFNKPVRGIEFDKEESEILGKLLLGSQDKVKPMKVLRSLINDGFFDEPKDLQTIRQSVRAQGLYLRSSLLNTLLAKMVERKEISRNGRQRLYTYKISHSQLT